LKLNEGVNLGYLFLNVNVIMNNFVAKLIDKIGMRKVNIRGFVDEDDIEEVKKFIRDRVSKEENKGITDGKGRNSR
jgi:hypothetical protein